MNYDVSVTEHLQKKKLYICFIKFQYQKKRRVEWLYEMPVTDKKKDEDYMTGKAVIDLYKDEKNQLRDLEDKKVAGSAFIDNGDDLTSVATEC